jgi:sarcosine oxidase
MIMARRHDLLATSLPLVYAGCGEPAFAGDPLRGEARADVVVIGAGITGASAAFHLAQAGARVRLLEAERVGAGGSGRAFGQVVPYLRTEPARTVSDLGTEAGERLIATAAGTPALVAELVSRHAIACDLDASGLIFAAHSAGGSVVLRERRGVWAARGVALPLLDMEQTLAAIGGGSYRAALVEPRGLSLNPLAYARGLARAASAAGATLHERSRVVGMSSSHGGWRVETTEGRIACDTLVVAAGVAIGGILPELRRRILPFRVHEAATAPLSADALAGILPRQRALTDTRRLPSGVRRTGDGRLVVTLSGPAGGGRAGDLGGGLARLRALFPHVDVTAFAESWSGWVDLAPDQYPRLVEPRPGLLVGYGLSGRGLGLGTALGQALARRALGSRADETSFPGMAGRPPRWLPGSSLAVAAAAASIRRIDAWQARQADAPRLPTSNGPRP